jgi:hypothetical protein
MINAKNELLRAIGNHTIKCAQMLFEHSWDDTTDILLRSNYSKEEYDDFLKKLDFSYDNGYGTQMLYGIVWFDNGAWLSRGEYDGSEWWIFNEYPRIPEILVNTKTI